MTQQLSHTPVQHTDRLTGRIYQSDQPVRLPDTGITGTLGTLLALVMIPLAIVPGVLGGLLSTLTIGWAVFILVAVALYLAAAVCLTIDAAQHARVPFGRAFTSGVRGPFVVIAMTISGAMH